VKESEVKIEHLEMLVKEFGHQLKHFENIHQGHLDENDIRALVDRILIDKEFATKNEIESIVYASQLQLVKWIIGTGISVIAIVVSIIQFI
jgi:hypothetical protein